MPAHPLFTGDGLARVAVWWGDGEVVRPAPDGEADAVPAGSGAAAGGPP